MKTMEQLSGNGARMARLTIATFLFGLLFALGSCEKDEPETSSKPSTPGTIMAPAFELKSLAGQTVKLADFKDRVLVLFFFGNACPSCKAAAPSIQSMLQGTFGSNSSFALIGLDQWDGNAASVESFKTSTGVTFPLLLMASSTAKAYSTTYDRFVVVDKSGNIVFSGKQLAGSDLSTVKSKVEMLLK